MSWLNATYYHLGPHGKQRINSYKLSSNCYIHPWLQHVYSYPTTQTHAYTLNKCNINNNNSITIILKALPKMSFWIAYTEKRKGAFPETILQNIRH